VEADEYERIAAAEDEHWWYRHTRSLLSDLLAPWLTRDRTILDVGCGPGANGASLGVHGTVIGLDAAPEALALVQQRQPAVHAVRGRVEQLPFADATFDVVIGVDVLYTVGPHTLAIEEMARALAPGGVLLVMEPAFTALRRAHDAQVHGRRRFRRNDLASLLEGAGLDVVRSTYGCSFLAPPAAALALWGRLGPRSHPGPPSDVDRRRLDRVFSPMAELERRWLRHHDLPIGTSVIVAATRP